MKINASYKDRTTHCDVRYIPSSTQNREDLKEAVKKLDLLEILVETSHKRKSATLYVISENIPISDYSVQLAILFKVYNGNISNVKLNYDPEDPPEKTWKINYDLKDGLVEILEPFKESSKDRLNRTFKVYRRGISFLEKNKLERRLGR